MDEQLKSRILEWAKRAPDGARQLLGLLESSLRIPPERFPDFVRANAERLGIPATLLEVYWEASDPHARQCLYWYLLGCCSVVSTPDRKALILSQVESLAKVGTIQ